MSAIGRIFLVLNLILSALFVGWASKVIKHEDSYRSQYEQAVTDAEAAAKAAEAELTAVSAQLQTVKAEEANATSERDDAEREVANLKADLEAERQRVADLESNVKTMTASLSDINATLGSMEDSKNNAVADAREARDARDAAVSARMQADTARKSVEDSLDQANQRIADLEVALTSANKMVSRQSAQLATIVNDYNIDLSSLMDQPYVEATVLSVKEANGIALVALNVGSDDNIKRGMTFQIWKNGRYKGEVRIESVTPGMSSALVTVLADDSVPMAEGDNAATRL